jgi:shikimate kinase / 3-dehydroquinate synthase
MTEAQAPSPSREDGMRDPRAQTIIDLLQGRSIVLVGMMGAGKTSVGKRLALALGLNFVDADHEIESAAGMSIPDIFERHGEAYFRDGERRVVNRLMHEGQRVIATGGGAFINPATRDDIARNGISIWLKADMDVLMRRVRKRLNRPLLQTVNPEQTMRQLMAQRYPIYGLADFTVISRDGPHENVVDLILASLEGGLPTLSKTAPHHKADNAADHDDHLPQAQVHVELAQRSYDIFIGPHLLRTAGERIAALFPKASCAIVTDHNLTPHLETLRRSLDDANIRHHTIVMTPGESSKSFQGFSNVCESVINARMERGDLIIALGGGVIGDLAGFAASAIRRGMRFVQIPTSLLAQVDSSVGGKTGINSHHGKNLVGAFHQPSLVLADTGTLKSLPLREFRAGYAEIVKYGLINNKPFFNWLEAHHTHIFAHQAELIEAIRISCQSKADVVSRDETEQGERALLNLGHTFGHALETLTHYNSQQLVHGEAVAIGMMCALRFSARLGYCTEDDVFHVKHHLKAVGLPTEISDVHGLNANADMILEAMFQDKKVERGALTFILLRGIGASFIAKNMPAADVYAFLNEELTGNDHA